MDFHKSFFWYYCNSTAAANKNKSSSLISQLQIPSPLTLDIENLNPLRPTHKMVKHTHTIRHLLPTNYLSVFDHFVGLALNELKRLRVISKVHHGHRTSDKQSKIKIHKPM